MYFDGGEIPINLSKILGFNSDPFSSYSIYRFPLGWSGIAQSGAWELGYLDPIHRVSNTAVYDAY